MRESLQRAGRRRFQRRSTVGATDGKQTGRRASYEAADPCNDLCSPNRVALATHGPPFTNGYFFPAIASCTHVMGIMNSGPRNKPSKMLIHVIAM